MTDPALEAFRASLAEAREAKVRPPHAALPKAVDYGPENVTSSGVPIPSDMHPAEFSRLALPEQMAHLTRRAMEVRLDILNLPKPHPDDLSLNAAKRLSLLETAANATINQSIKVEEGATYRKRRDDLLPEILARLKEERGAPRLSPSTAPST